MKTARSFCIYSLCVLAMLLSGLPALSGGLSPSLLARLSSAAPPERVRVIAYLRDTARARPEAVPEGRLIVRVMRARAELRERPVRQALAASGASHVVSLWAIQALAFEAKPATIRHIAGRRDVERLEEDVQSQAEVTPSQPASKKAESVPWNLERIGAEDLWEEGTDGTGVIVGVIDTGVDASHPDLAGKMVAGGWRDVVAGLSTPYDDNGHGTHITGTISGGNASGESIGVAPGVRFLSAKALDSANRFYGSWVVSAGQWMADPNGDGDSSDAPDIVNCSWLFDSPVETLYHPVLELWHSVGIWPVFAAGNRGPGAYTIGSPSSDRLALSVGMTNSSDLVADTSSRGPAPDMSPYDGALKPDVTAPGVSIRSSVPGGAYGFWTGTSMATPHVAGALALMRQALPTLTYEGAVQRLTLTALDRGAPGPDTSYGHGRINAYAAVHMPEGYVPPEISGIVRDTAGNPVADATVDALGTRTVTGPDGRFAIPHVGLATVSVTVDASGFEPLTKPVDVNEETLFTLAQRAEPELSNGGAEQDGGWTAPDASGALSRKNVANHTAGGAWALEVAAIGDGSARAWHSASIPVPSGGLVSLNAIYWWRATGDSSGRTTAIEWLDGSGHVLTTDYGTRFSPPTRGGPSDGTWRAVIQAFHAAPPAGTSFVRLQLGASFSPADLASRIWFDDAALDLVRAAGAGAITGSVMRDSAPVGNAIVGEHPFGLYFVPTDENGRYVLVTPATTVAVSAWAPGYQPATPAEVAVVENATLGDLDFTLQQTGRNVAPSGVHTASSTLDSGHSPPLAADGSIISAWSSAFGGGATPEAPVWWSVDEGAPRTLQSVEIEWESEPLKVRVEVSDDGVLWTPVAQGDGGGWREDAARTLSAITLQGVTARFLRVEDIGSNLPGRMGLWEVRVHTFPSSLPGDVDDSGTVTLADAVAVLRAAGGLEQAPLLFANGDLAPAGGDGILALHDALAVTRLSTGTSGQH